MLFGKETQYTLRNRQKEKEKQEIFFYFLNIYTTISTILALLQQLSNTINIIRRTLLLLFLSCQAKLSRRKNYWPNNNPGGIQTTHNHYYFNLFV